MLFRLVPADPRYLIRICRSRDEDFGNPPGIKLELGGMGETLFPLATLVRDDQIVKTSL